MNPTRTEIEQKIIPGYTIWKCSRCFKIFLDEKTATLCCFCTDCQKPKIGSYCQVCGIKTEIKYDERFIEKHTKDIVQLKTTLERLDYESKQSIKYE